MDRGDHSSDQPLLAVRTSPLLSYRPDSLAVFEDAIEVETARSFIGMDVQRVRYAQMAQVLVRHGLVIADLIVETRGGGTLEVRGVSKREAEHASTVIRERMASGLARGTDEPATLDIPDQIRKLAELRDSGAITEEEFQAKKRDFLDRM